MAIFLSIIITIFIVACLQILFFKLAQPYIKMIFDKAIDVACYVNTYHYDKTTEERVTIGQERFYKVLFKEDGKLASFKREKTDFIFWMLYTHYFDCLLDCIPIFVNRHNNRCLAEGELRGTEKYLDDIQQKLEKRYKSYATLKELTVRHDCESVAVEENNDK